MYQIYQQERRRLLQNALSGLKRLGSISNRKCAQREMAELRVKWVSIRLAQ